MTDTLCRDSAARPFYTRVIAGSSALVGHWLLLGQADPDRLAMILADTARLAKLGDPDGTPDGATLTAWSGDAAPPRWAARTALFLLVQMPARPTPRDTDEACAWAYCWLRNRDFPSLEAARDALPAHLQAPLHEVLEDAWQDHHGQRLI
ncbi:hypothetical protein EVC62_03215 [Salinicola endophyticus]|uniref:Uncharacterized protein n=1 Tax=Salinicola endophyticus TaxID=1949083 RepID=A0ABY8FG75_9GAMM|nr:hypothetical protein [Salinicola endophyticus]WFF40583.1 hypothetical protein EVC62_03215 [Salinicola endophyticus]